MARRDDEMHKLERGLIEAYRAQPDTPIDEDRMTGAVMRQIRQATSDTSQRRLSAALDQLVWRTAAIAAAVMLVMTVLTAGVIRSVQGESPGLLAEEFESAPLFGE